MIPSPAAIVAFLILVLRIPPGPATAECVEPLRGVWYLVATADARHTDPGSMDCTMTIGADGRVVLRAGDVVTNQGTVRLSRDGTARHIDLKLGGGGVLGVYAIDGGELVICCDQAGKARPGGLQPKGTQWVERWKRATN